MISDSNIILDFKKGNAHSFGQLYKDYFGMVKAFVNNNSGNTADAEDLFQDAMVVLVEKLRKDDFQLTASLKTYVMAIAKNLWLKRLRDNHRSVEFSDEHDNKFYDQIEQAIDNEKSYRDQLQTFLHKITKHCHGLIHDMFFKEKKIEQIQQEYGYSTKHNAQNQKHKCVEQIRKVKAEEEKIKK